MMYTNYDNITAYIVHLYNENLGTYKQFNGKSLHDANQSAIEAIPSNSIKL